MPFYYNLCSSSSGNCTYVGEKEAGLLFDAGAGIRILEGLLRQAGVDPCGILGVFVSHEHIDHVKGLSPLLKKYRLPLYASHGTLSALAKKGLLCPETPVFPLTAAVTLGGYTVTPFATSHDSAESLGFTVTTPMGSKIGLCTDLGYISDGVRQAVSGCDFLMLESNYDMEMLKNGDYAYFLKRRISGSFGHLSNRQCAEGLREFILSGTKQVVLAHLSENNNLPSLAREAAVSFLKQAGIIEGRDYFLDVLPKRSAGKIFSIDSAQQGAVL